MFLKILWYSQENICFGVSRDSNIDAFLWTQYCKIFKQSFFYKTLPVTAFSYSNQWKIFWEITALKFQGQHAAQFNFNRYEGLCPPTKHKSTAGVSDGILQNFRTATLENNFWGLLLKRKQRKKRMHSNPCTFRFSLFPGQFFIY